MGPGGLFKMRNIGGPVVSNQRLLMSATHAHMLTYALRQVCFMKKMAAAWRKGALRIESAYLTVSEPVVLLVAGTVTIDLIAFEKKRVYKGNVAPRLENTLSGIGRIL
ncbi:hypothetical protein J6590_076120 [Homalodisca vitripennis]|nr:hypothetical protein J6590_076120 [Homalodisca vitripennis]